MLGGAGGEHRPLCAGPGRGLAVSSRSTPALCIPDNALKIHGLWHSVVKLIVIMTIVLRQHTSLDVQEKNKWLVKHPFEACEETASLVHNKHLDMVFHYF